MAVKEDTRRSQGGTGKASAARKNQPSAAKNSSNRRTGNQARMTKKQKEEQKLEEEERLLEEGRKRQLHRNGLILGILVLCILLVLGMFQKKGFLASVSSYTLFGMFGLLGYIFPVFFLVEVFFFLSNQGNRRARRKLISGILIFLVLCAFWQLVLEGYQKDMGILDYFTAASRSRSGGGLFGGIQVYLWCRILGVAGAWVVILAELILLLMYFTEKFLFSYLGKKGIGWIGAIREKLREMKENREFYEDEPEEEVGKDELREEALERRSVREAVTESVIKRQPVLKPQPQSSFPGNDFGLGAKSSRKDFLQNPETGNVFLGESASEKKETDGRKREVQEREKAEEAEREREREVRAAFTITRGETKEKAKSTVLQVEKEPLPSAVPLYEKELASKFHADFAGEEGSAGNKKDDLPESLELDIDRMIQEGRENQEREASEFYETDVSGQGKEENYNRKNQRESVVRESVTEYGDTSAFGGEEKQGASDAVPEGAVSGETFLAEDMYYQTIPDEMGYGQEVPTEALSGKAVPDETEYSQSASDKVSLAEIQYSQKAPGETASTGDSYYQEVSDETVPGETEYYQEILENAGTYDAVYNEVADEKSGYLSENSAQASSQAAQTRMPQVDIQPITSDIIERPQAVQEPAGETGGREKTKTVSQLLDEVLEEKSSHPVAVKPKHIHQFPPIDLLNAPRAGQMGDSDAALQETANRLQMTLDSFKVKAVVTNASCGPQVTRFEVQPEPGVKVSKITGLADDIKLNLAAADIRIEAPIPGKAAVGIEVPNKAVAMVTLRELLDTEAFKKAASKVTFAVGKDISGQTVVTDIAKMPHLLIAGSTGSGKSVCINTLIMSILYKADPEDVKLIMVDPKVVELSIYNGIPHLLIPVVTDPNKALGALNWAVAEMEDRYAKFKDLAVRDLKGYNEKIKGVAQLGDERFQKLPQIVIILDELADLMMVTKGEVETPIVRLSQKARAAGIHLIIATQRPSVDVITGLIKANVPSRIAFLVSSQIDSRTILDTPGAEHLIGKGDMLFAPAGFLKPARVQGAFVSDEEVNRVVGFLTKQYEGNVYDETLAEKINSTVAEARTEEGPKAEEDGKDEYFKEAARLIVRKKKASIGLLQRAFKIGYNRAARMMDQLCEAGIVGEEQGTKPRELLVDEAAIEEVLERIS